MLQKAINVKKINVGGTVKMVQEMDHSVPEELYNLTQLADVTLAAGKLSTTNLEHVQDFTHDEKVFDYSRKYPVADEPVATQNQAIDYQPIFTSALKPQIEPFNDKLHSVIRANPPDHNEPIQKTASNLAADKLANFSSSEDDSSTFNYSHKIFDKRKSRKLSYQSDDSEYDARRFNQDRFSLFVEKSVPEVDDSLMSSETESHDCMEISKIGDSASSGEDVHVCPECGKKYSTSSNLARHRQTHRGEKPFPCNICAKAFADKSNLRAHVQTHSNTKPHTCSRCGKAFALKSYLYKHEESSCMRSIKPTEKSRPKPYRPDATKATVNIVTKFLKKSKHQQSDVPKKFKDKIKDKLKSTSDPTEPESIVTDLSSQKCYYDLTKPLHRKAFHLANKDSNETVDEWYHRLQDLALSCDYGCYLEMLLLDKLVVGLDEFILDRLCKEQKDLSLKNVIEFSRNYEVSSDHMDIKPEMVIVKQELELSDVEEDDESHSNCDINYTEDNSYRDGQVNEDVPLPFTTIVNTPTLVYDRPKVFECYLCHKWWPTVGHLTYHFGRHHTVGTISKCHLCGKWLKTPSSLVRHVNMHLSDRPYHCDLCDFSFASAISLKRHMIQHNKSESNAFKCSQCQKEFISQRHLRLHRKTHVSHESDDTTTNTNSNTIQSIDYKYYVPDTSFIPKEFSEIGESNFNSSFDVSLQTYSNEQAEAKRRPKIKRRWTFERKFSTHSDAINFVTTENIWSISTTNNITQGKKVLYRCRKAKQKGQQCEAGVSLLFCCDNDEVILHRAENPHTCQINCSPRNPMTIELIHTITRIFRDGRRKRKEIEAQLIAEGIGIPPHTQFNNLIRNLRCEYIKKQ
ncbi:hypothetical protein HA402_014334 [Bradysia odoriphaga]|nr:hypothetical protein HA402_014334 [Bradysia odoriphaga]